MSSIQEYSYGIIPYFINKEGKFIFFIGQQVSDGGEGFWKFPKGHPDDNETLLETALRETKEEIGITIHPEDVITDKKFREQYEFERESGSKRTVGKIEKVNIYLLGRVVVDGEKVPDVHLNDEFTKYRWATYEETMKLLPENSRKFLKEAHDYLEETKRQDI